MIRCIAALDSKNGIADAHGIPWQGKLPSDVAYFRAHTLNSSVLMGYGWYTEQRLPLPMRRNLVATTKPEQLREGFDKIPDARKFLQNTREDVWVGGGAALFASTIDLANELYLTRIDRDFQCTKFFPDFASDFFRASSSEPQTENGISFHFEIWKRN